MEKQAAEKPISDGEPCQLLPWEKDDAQAAEQANGPRQRHDAFDGPKKRKFLTTLAKTGCILDACRVAGVSNRTVYNHQASDPEFERHCRKALKMAAEDVETLAWQRAVEGIEEPVIHYGKVVGTRRKRSDSLFRLLLQGSNPKKYGVRPGFTRKRLLKEERKRIEREVYDRIALEGPSIEKLGEAILRRLDAAPSREEAAGIAAGWLEAPSAGETPRETRDDQDSLRKSCRS